MNESTYTRVGDSYTQEQNKTGQVPFSTGAYILEQNSNGIRYQIECDTPNGTMECYHLFPGIDLSYTTFYANSCFQREESFPHIIEIAFCKAGRYECEYKRGFMTYLGENDLAISVINSQREKPVFPTGFYDGVAIIINTDIVGEYFTAPVDGVEIDFAGLIRKFCSDRCCVVMKTPQELSHVFGELCNPIHKNSLGYLRLKVLETFLVLADISAQDDMETSAYFSGDTIKKVKALKTALMEQLDMKISLRELAKQYDLSLTMLKDCFKAVYGKPVHAFRREYKMQVATRLLITTDMSIAELAGKLGYENPNKFSTAFREVIGLSPREYRARNK